MNGGPDTSPGAIFSQPWWLEAVAPGAWDAVSIEKGGQVVARLPYVLQRERGMCLLTMPPLTQTLGPWLSPYPGKYANRLSRDKSLMTELIEGLPEFDLFKQHFHHSITNWLPFYWQGFQQTTRYTYLLEDLSDLDAVWDAFRSNIKTDIRKAEQELVVRDDLDLDIFLQIVARTFERQGRSMPYDHDLVGRIDRACRRRECARRFYAVDDQERVHAVAYLVWDECAAYYLMGGADPELRASGASSLLMWHAIQFAAGVTQTFDFEGSMIEPVERFFRAFGARQAPYFQVSKTNSLRLKVSADARSWARLLRGR